MRPPKIHFLVPAIAAISLSLSTCSKDKSAEAYYEKGIGFFKEYQFNKAINPFQDAIRMNPYFEMAYKRILDCYKLTKKLDLAIEYFDQLSKTNPDNPYPLFALGVVLTEKEDFPNAISYFKQAIRLEPPFEVNFQSLISAYEKDQNLNAGVEFMQELLEANPDNGYAHFGLAYAFVLQNDLDDALTHLNFAINLNPNQLHAYRLQVNILSNEGRFEEALALCKSAIDISGTIGDNESKVALRLAAGKIHRRAGEMTKALDYHQQALEYSRQLGWLDKSAEILNNLGIIYRETTEYETALRHLKQSLTMHRKLGNQVDVGMALGNIGDIYTSIDAYDSALVYYEQSLKIAEETDDKKNAAITFGSISNIHYYKGEYAKSIEFSKKAVKIHREIDNKVGEVYDLGNIGTVYFEQGDYQQALDYFTAGLQLATVVKNKSMQTISLGNLGETYQKLQDYDRALDYFHKAEKIAHAIHEKSLEAVWAGAKSAVYLAKGDTSQAIDNLQKALAILIDIKSRRDAATTYANLAVIYTQQGQQLQLAQHNVDSALAIHQRIGNQFGEGAAYNDLGKLQLKMKQHELALQSFGRALAIGERLSAAGIVWQARANLGETYAGQGKNAAALKQYEQALATIESVRGHLLAEEHKSSFLAGKIDIYHQAIDLLYEMNQADPNVQYAHEAFHYGERAKARTLLEMITEARVDIRHGVDPALLQREQNLFQDAAALQTELRSRGLSEEKKKDLTKQLERVEDSLQQLRTELKKNNPFYANLKYPEPLTLRDVQENVLHEGEVLLEYTLAEEHSYLWAMTKSQSYLYRLPGEKLIGAKVKPYIETISRAPKPEGLPYSAGKELYDLLIKPVSEILQTDANVIIVPDGILHYLPFETLVSQLEKRQPVYLVESFNIRYTQSASVLALLQERHVPGPAENRLDLLAFGDPVYSQEAAGEPDIVFARQRGLDLKRLPRSAVEVNNIARLFPKARQQIYVRQEATEEKVKSVDLTHYRYLHFATHGIFDETFPLRSCIVLTLDADPAEDGFLQLPEIFNLTLNSDLVVLSACQTGQGKVLRGEGLIGLTRAFYYAGAKAMVVSLWSINDQTTAELMANFYSAMIQGATKSQALRQAKLDFLNNEVAAKRHPYFWAAFILSGLL